MRVLSVRLHVFLLLVKRELEVCVLDKYTGFVNRGYIAVGFDEGMGHLKLAPGGKGPCREGHGSATDGSRICHRSADT